MPSRLSVSMLFMAFCFPPINPTCKFSLEPSHMVPMGQGLVMHEARASLTPGTGDTFYINVVQF